MNDTIYISDLSGVVTSSTTRTNSLLTVSGTTSTGCIKFKLHTSFAIANSSSKNLDWDIKVYDGYYEISCTPATYQTTIGEYNFFIELLSIPFEITLTGNQYYFTDMYGGACEGGELEKYEMITPLIHASYDYSCYATVKGNITSNKCIIYLSTSTPVYFDTYSESDDGYVVTYESYAPSSSECDKYFYTNTLGCIKITIEVTNTQIGTLTLERTTKHENPVINITFGSKLMVGTNGVTLSITNYVENESYTVTLTEEQSLTLPSCECYLSYLTYSYTFSPTYDGNGYYQSDTQYWKIGSDNFGGVIVDPDDSDSSTTTNFTITLNTNVSYSSIQESGSTIFGFTYGNSNTSIITSNTSDSSGNLVVTGHIPISAFSSNTCTVNINSSNSAYFKISISTYTNCTQSTVTTSGNKQSHTINCVLDTGVSCGSMVCIVTVI